MSQRGSAGSFNLLAALLSMFVIILFLKRVTSKSKDRRIYEAAIKYGFDENTALYVVAQARHETGNYTSRLCLIDNNYFGMRPAVVRPTVRLNKITETNYAIYRNLEDSVLDLSLWFDYNRLPKSFYSAVAYVNALKKKGYFEAQEAEYAKGVTAAITKINIS